MEKVVQLATYTSIICCGERSSLHGKIMKIFTKNRGIWRDEQTNFEYKENQINFFLVR